jgi:hypothetical protein
LKGLGVIRKKEEVNAALIGNHLLKHPLPLLILMLWSKKDISISL